MAGSVNKVFLMGNLTRDVQLKHTANNTAVANLGLAVNRRYRNNAGEMQEETTFVDCEAWGRTAETMAKYLSKGRPVFIEGRLRLDEWQDREGNRRSKLVVVIDTFTFVDSRGGNSGGGGGAGGGGKRSESSYQPTTGSQNTPDDIPF
ncbi:MAG: single-stranded DNA-binding protein [Phycisphaerales bacterium]|jgi:single-strand DNA-binding protein|nr:single-stranded DNA-binding protein [Phycisphaerales bacterium]